MFKKISLVLILVLISTVCHAGPVVFLRTGTKVYGDMSIGYVPSIADDGKVYWSSPGLGIPLNGTTGYLLRQASSTPGDVEFTDRFYADTILPNVTNQTTAGHLAFDGFNRLTLGNGTDIPSYFIPAARVSGGATMSTTGVVTLVGDTTAYDSSWNGSTKVPNQDTVYDKIQSLKLLSIVDTMPGSPSNETIYLDRSDGKIKIYDTDNNGQTGIWTLAEALTFADSTPPTMVSATVNSAGTQVTIVLSENCDVGGGGSGGWTLNSPTNALTYVSGDGTSTYVYSTANTVYSEQTPTISYTQPTNGLEDASNNDLASISGASVTNGSTQTQVGCGVTKLLGTDSDLNSTANLNPGYWYAFRFQASGTGNAGCVKIRLNNSNSGETSAVGYGIYSNNAGGAGDDDDKPGTQLASGSEASHTWTQGATLNELVMTSNASLTSGTLYWIVVHMDATSAVYVESGSGTYESRYIAGTYNTPPSTDASWNTRSDSEFSFSAW